MFRNILRSIVKSFMAHGRSQSGYILLSLMALTALIPGLVLIGLNYTDIIEQGSRISKTTITKTQMHTIRNIVANSARDVDADGAFDVWRERAGNTVPAAVTVNSRDQWGTDFRYCAYDLRVCNQVDAAFSQNNPNAPCVGFSPPTTNLVLRIISAGRDRAFQTDCRSASALGDDIVLNEVEAGIRTGGTGGGGGGGAGGGGVIGAGGGWTDDGSVVRLTDPNDWVGIGTSVPTTNLTVVGGLSVKRATTVTFSSFSYRRSITINNTNNPSTLRNYQVSIIVNTASLIAAGKMQADCDDMGFASLDGTSVLNHWLESGCNTTSTRVWVRVPLIPGGGTATIFMYYGAPTAGSTSNGAAVFDFFDDFLGSAIDTNRWTIVDATGFSVSGGELRGTNTQGQLRSVPTFSAPAIQEVRKRTIRYAMWNGHTTGGFWVSPTDGFTLLQHHTNDHIRSDAWWLTPVPWGNISPEGNIPLLLRFSAVGGNVGLTIIRLDTGTTTFSDSFANAVSSETIMIGRRGDGAFGGQSYDTFWDWIRVRQHASPEPTINVGGEQRVYAQHSTVVLVPSLRVDASTGDVDIMTRLNVQEHLNVQRYLSVGAPTPGGRIDVRDANNRQLLLTHFSGHSFLNAGLGGNAHLSGNLYWDGTHWHRFDTNRAGGFWWASTTGELAAIQVPAGANPIPHTWAWFDNVSLWIAQNRNIGMGTPTPVRRLDVRGGIIAFGYEHHSSRDSKSNIQTMKAEEALSILNQLRPVEFKYKDNPGERRLGFIAEEVPKILSSEDRQGVKIMDTVAALTKVIQEQQKEIEKLESNIKQLESNNASTASQNLDVTDIAFKSIVMILFIALFIKINKTKRGIKHG